MIFDSVTGEHVAEPICPMNMYFEGEEDRCDVSKCDYDFEFRGCTEACRKIPKSEFGKGLTYCIGLFLAHAKDGFGLIRPDVWFNGASDHIAELDTDSIKDEELKEQIDTWSIKVWHWGHGFCKPQATKEDIDWALQQAKDFLRQIDETILNVHTIKGQWE